MMKAPSAIKLIGIGLKETGLERLSQTQKHWRGHWSRYLKIGSGVLAGYLLFVALYVGVGMAINLQTLDSKKELSIYSGALIEAMVALQEENEQTKTPDLYLKRLAKPVKEMKWGNSYINDPTRISLKNPIKEFKAYVYPMIVSARAQSQADQEKSQEGISQMSLVSQDNIELKGNKIDTEPSDAYVKKLLDLGLLWDKESEAGEVFKIDIDFLHGVKSLMGYDVDNVPHSLDEMSYDALPLEAKKSYTLYMKNEVMYEVKQGFLIGWFLALSQFLVVLLFVVFPLCLGARYIYDTAMNRIFKKSKTKVLDLKKKGAELYDERLAKQEKEIFNQIIARKGEMSSRARSKAEVVEG